MYGLAKKIEIWFYIDMHYTVLYIWFYSNDSYNELAKDNTSKIYETCIWHVSIYHSEIYCNIFIQFSFFITHHSPATCHKSVCMFQLAAEPIKKKLKLPSSNSKLIQYHKFSVCEVFLTGIILVAGTGIRSRSLTKCTAVEFQAMSSDD